MKDEIDAKLEWERKKTIGKIVFTLLVILGIAFLTGLELSKPESRTIIDTVVPNYDYDFAVQNMLDDLDSNLTIHIAGNYTGNVTIWKGDKVVCFIPAVPVFTVRSFASNRTNIVPVN